MTVALPGTRECRSWFATIREHHQSGAGSEAWAPGQAGITPLTGGRNNTLYRCTRDGRTCCVKVYRADGRQRDEREWYALTFLDTHLPGLAPRPLRHEPDDRFPLVAMEYLPGTPLLDQPIDTQRLAALAARLTQIYALTPSSGDFPYVGESAPEKIIARIEQWAASDPQGVGDLLGRWLASADVALLRMPAAPVFGLADPNLLNWLWDDATGTLRRVDLEYAGWCDLESELADLVEGPWARGLADADWLAFARSFADLDRARFAAARRLFALFWVGLFAARGNERLSQQRTRATTLLEER